jgi:hypothetical protein
MLPRFENNSMKDIVADAIRFYFQEDNDSVFLERCRAPLDVADLINTTVAEFDAKILVQSSVYGPRYKLQVGFGTYRRDLFEAEFVTEIVVSKLVKLFNVLHAFSVENRHEQRVEPTLDGTGNTGFIMKQFEFHEALSQRLIERGYTELDHADMKEVIPTLSMPEDVTIFGRQVTVWFALFHDLRRLCPED